MDAALRLFAEQGFREATMARLADDVGLSEAALYRYFPSKDALFAALEAYLDRRVEEGALAPSDTGVAARGFLGMFTFFMVVSQLFLGQAGLPSRFRHETIAESLVRVLLDGMRPR